MQAGIVEAGIVVNIIEVDENTDLDLFNAVEIPDGTKIGDAYAPPEPTYEPTLEDRVTALEESSTDDSAIWDELARAYMEGVNEA